MGKYYEKPDLVGGSKLEGGKGEGEGIRGRKVRERMNYEKQDLVGGSELEGGKGEGNVIRGEKLGKE